MIPPGCRRVGLWPAFFYYRNRNGGWALSQALEQASSGLAGTSVMSSGKPSESRTSEGRAAEVERLIGPAIAAMGYDIVRVELSGGARMRLQIMADPPSGGRMGVEDCPPGSRPHAGHLHAEIPNHIGR